VVDIWRLPKPIPISSSLTGKTEYLGNTVEVDIKSDYATNQTMNSEKAQIYIVDAPINGLDAPKKTRPNSQTSTLLDSLSNSPNASESSCLD
jgi:hypothetical protein